MDRRLNFFTNGTPVDSTGWTLGTGYSIVNNEYLEWNSVTDTTAVASFTLDIPIGTMILFTCDFFATLNDDTIVTNGSGGGLDNAVLFVKKMDGTTIGTTFIGETQGNWERRAFFVPPDTSKIKIEFRGRRAGVARWKNIKVEKITPTRAGQRRAPELNLPSYKGGNIGDILNSSGSNIFANFLSSSNYTTPNKNAWKAAFTNKYLANGINVCRLMFNIFGNYGATNHIANSTWSALQATESANLRDFLENVVPLGVKLCAVMTYHTDIPDSIYNTGLTPSPAHQTKANWLARCRDVSAIMADYPDKICMIEAINESDASIGTNVTWGMWASLLRAFYDDVKLETSEIPVTVSEVNKAIQYHDLLIAGSCDILQYHYYGETPTLSQLGTTLNIIPEVHQLPCVMGEGRFINGDAHPVENAEYLRQANDLYYHLGYEGFWPWTIKGYGGEEGSSDQDLNWTAERAQKLIGTRTEVAE